MGAGYDPLRFVYQASIGIVEVKLVQKAFL